MRYIARKPRPAKATGYDDWYDTGGPGQITVHEAESAQVFTGLLDMHGNELCRVPESVPMGFRVK